MSGAAHNGEDDIAFFAADIGFTRVLPLTTALSIMPAVDGALVPGRYLVQVVGLTSGAVAWLHFDKYDKLVAPNPLPLTGQGPQRMPLVPGGIIAIETHVLKGYSDRLCAVVTIGTATLYATLVSRDA